MHRLSPISVQISAEVGAPGLVSSVSAVAFTTSFTQPGAATQANLCRMVPLVRREKCNDMTLSCLLIFTCEQSLKVFMTKIPNQFEGMDPIGYGNLQLEAHQARLCFE